MGWAVAAWIVVSLLVHDSNQGLGDFMFWAGVLGFGFAYWQKKAPEREAAARAAQAAVRAKEAAELAKKREAVQSEVRGWHSGPYLRPTPDKSSYRPGPAGSPRVGGRTERVETRRAQLRTGDQVRLPDAAQARALLGETVTDLTRAISGEARQLGRRLGGLPNSGCEPARFRRSGGPLGWQEPETGARLTAAAADLVNRVFAWSTARQTVVEALHPAAARDLGPVVGAARQVVSALDRPRGDLAFEGQERAVLPAGEWPELLAELRHCLDLAADALGTRPPFEPAALVGPPKDARFEAHVAPSAVDERLSDFLLDRTRRFTALAQGTGVLRGSDWDLGAGILDGFLTTEVARRFHRATEGATAVADWPEDTVTTEVRRRLHLAHLALALNYLMEVSNQMQEYTDRSGMGEPSRPVTINGNVGAVNIADTIQIIGSHVAAIMQRGDDRSAAAIDALNSAIQQESRLGEQQRAELLDNLADVSEAAANPTERRLRTRARLALTAIAEVGAAIGATSPIAQAITDWQHVYTGLF